MTYMSYNTDAHFNRAILGGHNHMLARFSLIVALVFCFLVFLLVMGLRKVNDITKLSHKEAYNTPWRFCASLWH